MAVERLNFAQIIIEYLGRQRYINGRQIKSPQRQDVTGQGRHVIWELISRRSVMPTGSVKWFDPKKGFGFIVNPQGKDVFVHFTSIEGDGFRSLKDGEPVDYEQVQGEKGLLAQHVKRLSAAAKDATSNASRPA